MMVLPAILILNLQEAHAASESDEMVAVDLLSENRDRKLRRGCGVSY